MASYTNTIHVARQTAPFGATTLATTDDLTLNLASFTLQSSGALSLGATNTTSLTLGRTGIVTTVGGDLVVSGDFTVNGTTTTVNSTVVQVDDNMMFVNSGPSGSADAGYAIERYQIANNAGTGDVVGDSNALVASFSDIGDQTGQDGTHIYLSGGSAVDDYYVGMWVRAGSDVRKIIAYNGTTKVATVGTAWNTQPASNSSAPVYTPFAAMLFDEQNNVWRFVSLTSTGTIVGNMSVTFGDIMLGQATASTGFVGPSIKASGGDFTVAGGNGSGGILLKTNGTTGTLKLDIDHSGGLTVYDDIQPDTDSAYNFGSSSAAWATGYFDTLTSLNANDRLKLGTDAQVLLSLPVFTTQQITDNIAAPAAGDLVYDSTTGSVKYRGAASWISLVAAGDTTGLTGTTSLSYTINNDGGGSADEDAILYLVSDNGANKDTGSLTYVAGALGGSDRSNFGTWAYSAHVSLIDNKSIKLGTGSDLSLYHDGSDSYIANTTGALLISNSDATNAIILKTGTADADTSVAFKNSANAMLFRVQGDGSIQTYSGTFDVDATGAVAVDTTAGISLDSATASNFTVTGASQDLTLSSVGGSVSVAASENAADAIKLNASAGGIDIDSAGALDILAGGAFSIDGTGASNVSATSGNLTLSTITSGSLILDGVALVDINAGANLDVDVTGTVDILSSGAFSIDGTGASNVSATSGDLTLSTITSGALVLTSAGALTLTSGGNSTWDMSAGTLSIGLKDNQASAFALAEGSNKYLDISTADAQAVLALGNSTTLPFIDMGGTAAGKLYGAIIGFTANAIAGGVSAGDVLYLSTAGTVGKADADAAGKTFVVGIAAEAAAGGAACRVASMPGQVVNVSADLSAMAVGDVVFMSKTAGSLTNDVSGYTSSGDTLFRVGFVHTAAAGGNGKIIYMPQFVQIAA